MSSLKKVVFTGGGTFGHVSLNKALTPVAQQDGFQVHYIGSNGIEFETMSSVSEVQYHIIQSGKLRRYLSFENLVDIFKVIYATLQCLILLYKIKPIGVFSKGGYVAVPVCLAARLLKIPVVTHESDITPGLATKIISSFASRIFTTFESTLKFFAKGNTQCVGSPMRPELGQGSRDEGFRLTGFKADEKKVLLIMGGSLGAQRINDALKAHVKELTQKFNIIHITGRGKRVFHEDPVGYKSFEFLKDELPHVFSITDFAVSRAGSNSIFEFLQLNIPMLLIPLEIGSRGDQVDNAKEFKSQGWAEVLFETEMDGNKFLQSINELVSHAENMKQTQKDIPKVYSLEELWALIKSIF